MLCVSHRHLQTVAACALFALLALMLAGMPQAMLIDTDPLWHIAAGDLIREHRALPAADPWSFTAGDYPWLNISWLWDYIMSLAVEKIGWQGAIALNALTIAGTVALLFLSGLARSGRILPALIAAAASLTLMSAMLRPLQVTGLMTALWLLLLGNVIRGRWPLGRLAFLPATMLLWVNMHGGFLVGPLLIGAFWLQAFYFGHAKLARALFFTGLATLAAMLCNPYGVGIIEAARRPLTTVANAFILEWQPLALSPQALAAHGAALLFVALVVRRKLPVSPAERWLAYLWLLASCLSVRHFAVFAAASAPVLACALAAALPPIAPTVDAALTHVYGRRAMANLALAAALGLALWLPSPWARHETVALPTLAPEIAFIEKSLPGARILAHFNLAATLAYDTRGRIPVFVDPRTETAFPPGIMADYACFEALCPDMEAMLARWRIDAVMLPREGGASVLRLNRFFAAARGWRTAFEGPSAIIYRRAAAGA